MELLSAAGLAVSVPVRRVMRMTKLLEERASMLAGPRPWGPATGTYELVVVRGARR
jgi:hypothetical protein